MEIQCPRCEKIHINKNMPFYCSCKYYISQQTINVDMSRYKTNNNSNKKPSIIKQAQNFTKSIINHVSNGMIKVSDSVKQERMSICQQCPFFNMSDSKNPTCNQCGCFLEVKTGWASEKCPEGKWLEVKTQSSGGCGCSKKT